MSLSDHSIIAWLNEHQMKTEKGDPLTFKDHMFLYDIYRDMSPKQCVMKPAQVGMSTVQNFKPFWIAKTQKMDIIYTLPTDSDVTDFVNSKTNRIIAQNPEIQKLTQDRDTIEQKKVGESMIYYRGTWVKKAAMMVPADLLIHDEIDASKQDIIEDYETRIQHSRFKWRWVFSHPSTEGVGVHKYWLLSDQKHWFIKCRHCGSEEYLEWPYSIDEERGIFLSKKCNGEITDDDRRRGRWVKKYKDREWSGYWISALMCPWISAKEILDKFYHKDPEYFYTKVLGLPYIGAGNKVTEDIIMRNVTNVAYIPKSRVIIGVDTGLEIHYVCGTQEGMFKHGSVPSYNEIEDMLKLWPTAIAVFDQGGDLIKPRELAEKYQGRIFLCYYQKDRKSSEILRWGDNERKGDVFVDRNRMISMLIGEFENKRIPLHGTKDYWKGFYEHFSNMYRVKEENKQTKIMEYKWERSGPDHLAHAALYCRVGLDRFGVPSGKVFDGDFFSGIEETPSITPDGRISQSFKKVN